MSRKFEGLSIRMSDKKKDRIKKKANLLGYSTVTDFVNAIADDHVLVASAQMLQEERLLIVFEPEGNVVVELSQDPEYNGDLGLLVNRRLLDYYRPDRQTVKEEKSEHEF